MHKSLSHIKIPGRKGVTVIDEEWLRNIDPPFFFKIKISFQKFFLVPYSVNTKFSAVISINYLNHFLLFINCKPYPNNITLDDNSKFIDQKYIIFNHLDIISISALFYLEFDLINSY